MILREAALNEIYNRVFVAKDTLGLLSFKRSSTSPVNSDMLPCVFMIEDIDEVIESSSRGMLGYPMRRRLEVVLEIITNKEYDIKQLYRDVRSTVLANNPVVADNAFIREIRTEGPTGYGLPDVLGMRLVFSLMYVDDGN